MSKKSDRILNSLIRDGHIKIGSGKIGFKRPSRIDKRRIMNDPRYHLTRKNMQEFASVAKANKLLRESLRCYGFRYDKLHHRLQTLFHKMIKTDEVHVRGERSLMCSDLKMLQGFQFNAEGNLPYVLHTGLISLINTKKGEAVLYVPQLNPTYDLSWPENAEVAQIESVIISIDFIQNKADGFRTSSVMISCKTKIVTPFQLITDIGDTRDRILIHCVGVRFFYTVSGNLYQIMSKKFMPLDVYSVKRGEG